MNGALDARGDKIVTTPQPATEVVVSLAGALARFNQGPAVNPERLVSAVRDFDRTALLEQLTAIRDMRQDLLLAWLSDPAPPLPSHTA